MKFRSDYVSNSSSSSFIVSIQREYPFHQFVKDVVDGSTDVKGGDATLPDSVVRQVGERNAMKLEYCLNTYELLFLGTLTVDHRRRTIEGMKPIADYLRNEEIRSRIPSGRPTATVVSNDGYRLVVDVPVVAHGVTVPSDEMQSSIRHYVSAREDSQIHHSSIAESIMECARASSNPNSYGSHAGLYEITLNTIVNTETLISEGMELKLAGWCSNLDGLRETIEGGGRIFGVEMRHGGEGEGSTAVYAFGGWDADAFSRTDVKILSCETD